MNPGSTVYHPKFGNGTFKGYETANTTFKGFAIVEFDTYPGISLVSPKKLTLVKL